MKWNLISFRFWSMSFEYFSVKFWWFFSEVHGCWIRCSQKMMNCVDILVDIARQMRKKAKNSGNSAKFHSFISFFIPLLTLGHCPISWAANQQVPCNAVAELAASRNPMLQRDGAATQLALSATVQVAAPEWRTRISASYSYAYLKIAAVISLERNSSHVCMVT